jgi:DNA-binding transcriptional ArsR family regulator
MTGSMDADAEAEAASDVLKALSHPVRLRIVLLLSSVGSCSYTDIQRTLSRPSPSVIHHLNVLLASGLIRRDLTRNRASNKFSYYRLSGEAPSRVARASRILSSLAAPGGGEP